MLLSCGDDSEPYHDPPSAGVFRVSVNMPLDVGRAAHGGTLFSIVSADGVVRATAGISKTWNSYCASDPLQLHFFLGDAHQFPLTTERLGNPSPELRTGYGFSDANSLIVVDRANDKQFRQIAHASTLSTDATWQQVPQEAKVRCPRFTLDGWDYSQNTSGAVWACYEADESDPDPDCDVMATAPQTFPYVFADAAGNVITVTNWGDVLIHRPEGWCRAVFDGEGFACPPAGAPPAPPPEAPRGFQFYSSIKYRGETLLGRFPGGQLYRFDGTRLAPYEDSPPLPPGEVADNAEAQSMANYCGDLYVGLWPRGSVWVRRLHDGTWSRLGRMFTHPQTQDPAIPYFGSEPDGTPSAFLGERVSALVPQDERLYLTTSNLGVWSADVRAPEFLSKQQIDEYGAVYALHRPGCLTAQLQDLDGGRLYFDIGPTVISIRQGRRLLAQMENPGFMPSPDDQIVSWSPVFGEPVGTILSR